MSRPTYVLGISAYYHDAAAALLQDGEIVAAAQEERFSRTKGDATFPHRAVDFCLREAGLREDQLDHVAFYEDPVVKFERLTTTYHLTAPNSLKSFLRAFPKWLTTNLWLEREIQRELGIDKPIAFCDHHLSHAASAFFPSPFKQAAILTIDGVGEWSTTTFGTGTDNQIQLNREIRFPDSVGLLYSAFTYFTGFKINSGEYKLMGLAPYGQPRFANSIREKLVNILPDGSIQLNQEYFDYLGGLTMTNDRFADLFGGPPRKPESRITQREMDIAASIQTVLNEVVLRMAKHVHSETGMKRLVMAGGVALNVVSTGLLAREGPFDELWIQPAAGDAGGALGAALWHWHMQLSNPRTPTVPDSMRGSLLGPDIAAGSDSDDAVLRDLGAVWETVDDNDLPRTIANLIADGNIVAVARGRMEWGPRALGARSILGDPRRQDMQSRMNLKIKFRESFRPFAPMVLAEDASEYFDMREESPYMLFAYPLSERHRIDATDASSGLEGIDLLKVPRSDIPAVTHVDYSARVQTIDAMRSPFIYRVLREFKAATGCSVLINTSFNVRGEPIVCTAADAYRCFVATNIDHLVIGNRLLSRPEQSQRFRSETEREAWLSTFELD
jgi:carbamoyltransferase